MNILKVGSAFTGIGAWEKGLKDAGVVFDLKWFIENDKNAEISYCAIHGINKELNKEDITQVHVDELEDVDVFTYSPPCQSFSSSGKQLGDKDPRGKLFYNALKIIQDKKPRIALMENVVGLTHKKFEKLFGDMLNELDKAGYSNYYKILDAKDFNMPHNRSRVFIVSVRKDIDKGFDFPKAIPLTKELKDIVEIDFKENIDSRIMKSCQSVFAEEYESMLTTNKEIYQCKATSGWQDKKVGIKVSPCLRANKNHTSVMVDGHIKRLNTKEMFLLMGFSEEDYNKAKEQGVSDSQLAKQAGNSIVSSVAKHIF